MMQLHQDDASLAHTNNGNISDTDSEATIPDTTSDFMSAQDLGPTRWPSPTSPTEPAAARRKKLKTRSSGLRRATTLSSGEGMSNFTVGVHSRNRDDSSRLHRAPCEPLEEAPSLLLHPFTQPIISSPCYRPPSQL